MTLRVERVDRPQIGHEGRIEALREAAETGIKALRVLKPVRL